MGKEKKKKALKQNAKKEIYEKLTQTLGEFQNGHPKKFEKALQKASKLFVPFIIKKQPAVEEESTVEK